MSGAVRFCLVLAALLGEARHAVGAPCLALRPTSAEADWSYAGAKSAAFDTLPGNVRVWYATEGKHAPPGVSEGVTPPAATEAGAAAEAALARYDQLGFRRPVSDAATACADNGGDGRIDVYLFDFNAADGTVLFADCSSESPQVCAGFALVENDFASAGYVSMAEGFRTVVPHELFHLVQQAYSMNGEPWWSEGTAQWATKLVYPELQDLERLLPAYFQRTERALDFPALGAAAGFSYGAAIWPVFLSERFADELPRAVFEQLAAGAQDVLAASEVALAEHAGLAASFAEFARWNVATGARAGASGYGNAAAYPQVTVQPLAEAVPSQLASKLAGLSARYFTSPGGAARVISLEGDAKRVGAWFVPLSAGVAQLSEASELPFAGEAPGIVVVSGRAVDHRDVPFTLDIVAPELPTMEESGGAAGAPSEPKGAGAGHGGAAHEPSGGAGLGAPGGTAQIAGADGGDTGDPPDASAPEPDPDSSRPHSRAAAATNSGCSLSPHERASNLDLGGLLVALVLASSVRAAAPKRGQSKPRRAAGA